MNRELIGVETSNEPERPLPVDPRPVLLDPAATSAPRDAPRGPRFVLPSRGEMVGFLGYLLAQVFCVVGLVTERYPDSYGYFHLSFSGKAEFPPTVPFVYAVFGTDALRVGVQCLLATVSWWLLAKVAANAVADRRVRIGLRAVLLFLGLAGPIVSWNTVILSESIAISLSALAVGAWLAFQQRPTWWRALGAVAATEFWVLTKPTHLVIGALIALVAVVHALRHYRQVVVLAVALALVALSALNTFTFGSNSNIDVGVLSDIIADRILVNPSYTSWFVQHGMPYSVAVANGANGAYGTGLQQIPALESWMTSSGTSTYLRFMLEHPGYTLVAPLAGFSGEKASLHEVANPVYVGTEPNPTPSLLSPTADYGRYRQILPSVVEDFLFEQGQIGNLLALAAGAIACAWLARKRGRDRRLLLPILVAASAIPYGYLVWLAGGVGEVDRLSMVLAVLARIGLWLLLAYALDRLLSERSARRSVATGRAVAEHDGVGHNGDAGNGARWHSPASPLPATGA